MVQCSAKKGWIFKNLDGMLRSRYPVPGETQVRRGGPAQETRSRKRARGGCSLATRPGSGKRRTKMERLFSTDRYLATGDWWSCRSSRNWDGGEGRRDWEEQEAEQTSSRCRAWRGRSGGRSRGRRCRCATAPGGRWSPRGSPARSPLRTRRRSSPTPSNSSPTTQGEWGTLQRKGIDDRGEEYSLHKWKTFLFVAYPLILAPPRHMICAKLLYYCALSLFT